jgi:hypothetical protein
MMAALGSGGTRMNRRWWSRRSSGRRQRRHPIAAERPPARLLGPPHASLAPKLRAVASRTDSHQPAAPPHCHRTVLRLSQNPNSEHLGTTVWDASIVMAKYLEKVGQGSSALAATNYLITSASSITALPRTGRRLRAGSATRPPTHPPTPCPGPPPLQSVRKGDFARAKARGKRCIELGAGMGLGGIAMAMIGADVVRLAHLAGCACWHAMLAGRAACPLPAARRRQPAVCLAASALGASPCMGPGVCAAQPGGGRPCAALLRRC